MGGPNDYGLPAGLFRQAESARWVDQHVDDRMSPPDCRDPGILMLARTIACAIKDKRPTVTLPPHVYIPFRSQPWMVEARVILNGSTDPVVEAGALAAAAAEGIPSILETVNFTAIIQFQVPRGKVAVLREWSAENDELGYFQDATGQALVRHVLDIGEGLTIYPPTLLGVRSRIKTPFGANQVGEVSYVIPEDDIVSVRSRSFDQTMWHEVECFMTGYLIETSEINDTIDSLLGTSKCK